MKNTFLTMTVLARFSSFLLFGCIALGFFACEEEEVSQTADQAVIESYLISGEAIQVKITQIIAFDPENQQTRQTLDKLPVSIIHRGKKYPLSAQGEGIYTLDAKTLVPQAGEAYGLEVIYGSKTLTANTEIPAKPLGFTSSTSTFTVPTFGGGFPSFPDPVKLNWKSESGAYYLLVVKNIESSPDPIFENIDPEDLPNFRSEPIQANSYELNFQNFRFLGRHQVILYRIRPEYATLYEQNGTNSLNLANVPTNIEGGGLGIFTGIAAADVLSLTVNN